MGRGYVPLPATVATRLSLCRVEHAADLSTLRVTRPRIQWADRLRSYRVLVDGAERARLRNGDAVDIALPAGEYDVRVVIDWTGSKHLSVRLTAGKTTSITVRWRGNLLSSDGYLALAEDGG